MHTIEKKGYGYKLTFQGVIPAEEMTKWVEEARSALSRQNGAFGVFVDMRELSPLTPEVKMIMESGQKLFKEKGMERSVVILANAVVSLQFKDIAKKSGIYAWERYIDASSNLNWEQIGEDWIKNSIDPDLKK